MRCGVVIGLVLATSGCSAVFGLENPVSSDAGGTKDVGADAVPVCVGVGNYLECLPAGILDRLDYTGNTTIVTDQQCPIVDASNPSWCIFAAHHVTVTGNVRATGSRFFVLIGTQDLTISGTGVIDVASHVATSPGAGLGAGANTSACSSLNGAGTPDVNGGGGGAGGTYSTAGGAGGNGGGGGAGGSPAAVDPQGILGTTLRSGCKGGDGGAGSSNSSDPAGAGGGGVYLASKGALTIDGSVNASGAGGGRGAVMKGGGSGGGSGGMIALWSTTLVVNGSVFANGGGGGGGSDTAAQGTAGGDSAGAEIAAHGGGGGGAPGCGQGPGCGGDGAIKLGDGKSGYDDTTSAGGGGGGGGLGVIRIVSGQTTNGTFSPQPILD